MIKVEQQNYHGEQKRPYADHVWKWLLTVTENESYNTVLQWCLNNLKVWGENQLPKDEYYQIIRDTNASFEDTMKAECRGYYDLIQGREYDDMFTFIIVQPYID